MRRIAAFVEDFAHQQFLSVLIPRLAEEFGQQVELIWGNTRHGHGAVVRELKQFLRDLQRGKRAPPDLIIVSTDGNCIGYSARRREITDNTDRVAGRIICAIPDPHIERWLMLDSSAFKQVFGTGCDAPDQKCDRDRYKSLLVQAIRKSGIFPSLGGVEFADAIAASLDLDRASRADRSFAHFVDDLRNVFREWQA